MSNKQIISLKDKTDNLFKIKRAPSQFQVLFHLINTGKTMSVKELSTEINLTPKATERALSKLFEKELVQRNPFKDGGYYCDVKDVVLYILFKMIELNDDFEKRNPNSKNSVSPLISEEPRPQSTLLP
ncbi:hypothetical protein JW865_01465 [Candidatus Bathyarchaeota archaeon]|nr:hypothetical protein [Candidatus Bathyarchaeota archaeon]